MSPRETPEEYHWRKLLYAVNEYCKERLDPDERLRYDQVGSLVGGEEIYEPEIDESGTAAYNAFGLRKHQQDQIYLFKQMVEEEKLISAKLYEAPFGGPPFLFAHITGLTVKGHQFIAEMTKDQEEIVEELRAIKASLARLEPEKKEMGERIIDELIMFLRLLTQTELQEFLEKLRHLLES